MSSSTAEIKFIWKLPHSVKVWKTNTSQPTDSNFYM